MADDNRYTEAELDRKMAVETFNGVWDFLDKKERTPADDAAMLGLAHASRYHWGRVGTALEFARGDQMLSHVYAVLKQPELALRYAEGCLSLCRQNNIGDFDLAFAYSSMAQAYWLAGNRPEALKNYQLAEQAAEQIAKQEDRDYFLSVLHALPVKPD